MRMNRNAVVSLPVSLLIALIVSGVVIGMITLSAYKGYQDAELYQITRQVNTLLVEAEAMFTYADEGSFKRIRVSLPSSLRGIVFGGLPANVSSVPQNQTLREQTSNNYYVVMKDGTTKTYHCSVRFSDPTFQHSVVLYPGTYDITLEVQTYGGKSYVAISQQ